MSEAGFNASRREADKRLRAMYDAVPPETKRKFKSFRFHIRGTSANSLPHVFYGVDREQAAEYAAIWAKARGLTLESEEALS